jgi:2,3-bisphosphoglycerate-independent phosphoglycerate mutase
MEKKRAILLIMDGWGHGKSPKSDAIYQANVPFVKSLYQKYPNAELVTCGEAVGLPDGQMGNSEVGHLNLGAGRIVYQELQRINVAVRDGSLAENEALLQAIDYCKANHKTLHLVGLVSDGGVHSHLDHLKALCDIAKANGLHEVAIHAFTDGRDTDPKSGYGYLNNVMEHLQESVGRIASITGRYYGMDRDKRWERVKLAYDALVNGVGKPATDPLKAIQESYAENITDEFIKPVIITNEDGTPVATIKADDAVICFNFRTDRCREISEVLSQVALPEHGMEPLQLHFTTMTEYDKTFRNVNVIFQNDNLNNTIGEVIAANGLKQIRIAETEKYPHVTFFFSGGREAEFEGEKRILIPSPKDVPTYDFKPEMSANEITAAILSEIAAQTADFICLNFANADMVGHTGVFSAAIKAAQTVDNCVNQICTLAIEKGYTVFLTADHGNADYMTNEDGSPNTAHTLNLVPLFVVSAHFEGTVKNGKLGDLAPTILHYMGVPVPAEMSGEILIA